MSLRYTAPRGTRDVLPEESHLWQYVEEQWRTLCHLYGYREIRTPLFEETELFVRSVGETTDIVTKEMYTFEDRGGRSLTLKPEGTAPVVRAYLEHSLAASGGVTKVYYLIPIFRYERPQKGRYRQAHQLGVELIGAAEPTADAEVIALTLQFYRTLGFPDEVIELHLNTVGCSRCRPAYRDAIRRYAQAYSTQLCPTCSERLERNPLRLLDCKEPQCDRLMADAPRIEEYLCESCRSHFETLLTILAAIQVPYVRNHRLVRGLDYYTKTAFEVIGKQLGAQNSLCGGGRYDELIEECGGAPTPALGVALGMERTLLMLQELHYPLPEPPKPQVFVSYVGAEARLVAFQWVQHLRSAGIAAEIDHTNRSLKAQMRLADRSGARYALLLGADELTRGTATIRDLKEKTQQEVTLEQLLKKLKG